MAIPRIVLCGAVDDGKSTLLGRLLAETQSVPLDEVSSTRQSDGSIDFSRLTDGLEAERLQGITIDVAYRYLKLPGGRRALVADSPGHDQYTRNMAVAASLADVAVLVVDAVRGVRQQTIRHARVCRLMGITRFIVAINKVDAVPNPVTAVEEIRQQLSARLIPMRLTFVAVSGLRGDNVTGNQSLLTAINSAVHDLPGENLSADVRLPIQMVIRKDDRRWFSGRLASGQLSVGTDVTIWPSGSTATIMNLQCAGRSTVGPITSGMSVAVELDRETDITRGDIIVSSERSEPSGHLARVSRAHLADLVWLDSEPLDPSASYVMRAGPLEVPARVEQVRYVMDLDDDKELPAATLNANDIGRVEITCDRPVLLDAYRASRDTGGFILCDRRSGRTIAAGMELEPLRRESDVTRHSFIVTRDAREKENGTRAGVLWLTGLPGSGKSTIADTAERMLFERGVRSYILDGDSVRQTLSEDLGFSPEDRRENVRRVARTAQLMMDAGLIVIVSLVSPFSADRAAARALFANSDFAEVFVDTPLSVCQERDPKGLYVKAAASPDSQMTGAGQGYEAPESPELHLIGTDSLDENAAKIVSWVMARREGLRAT